LPQLVRQRRGILVRLRAGFYPRLALVRHPLAVLVDDLELGRQRGVLGADLGACFLLDRFPLLRRQLIQLIPCQPVVLLDPAVLPVTFGVVEPGQDTVGVVVGPPRSTSVLKERVDLARGRVEGEPVGPQPPHGSPSPLLRLVLILTVLPAPDTQCVADQPVTCRRQFPLGSWSGRSSQRGERPGSCMSSA